MNARRTAFVRAVGATAANLACLAPIVLGGAAANAQAPTAPPTREQVTRPEHGRPNETGLRLAIEGDIARASCSLDRPEYQDIRFTLDSVVFDDLRGLSADDLASAYAGLIGEDIPLSAICDIRDRATALLTQAGYVAAVEVPEQRIGDGAVHLKVIMARLVDLRINGAAGSSERLIAAYLAPLTRQVVFNRHEAERHLLLAGDLPGHRVRLALLPAGTARGDVVGEVTVQRYRGAADVTVQNDGSDEIGPWGVLARAQVYGLTGMGDRTSLAVFSTPDSDEQRTVQIGHDFRVGGEGLTLGGQFTYSWGRPDVGVANFDIRSKTMFASVEASYPLLRTETTSLRGAAGLDLADQDVEFNGIQLSRDRLRVAYVRLIYDATGVTPVELGYSPVSPHWRVGGQVEARQGIDGLGASDPCGAGLLNCFLPNVVPPSRLEGNPSAFVVRGEMNAEFRPRPKLTFALEARAQYSADPLFSFEEFSAGNYTIGRGYDPGVLQGDSGVAVRGEIRWGDVVPASRDSWAVEWFGFVDQAWTRDQDELFIIPDAEVTSVGAGVRAVWGDRLRVQAMVAAPLDPPPLQTSRDDTRFMLTLTTRLLPWSFR